MNQHKQQQAINLLKEKVFKVNSENFEALALEIFQFQSKNNPVYAKFLELIDIRPESVVHAEAIPHLPVAFFKTQNVRTVPTTPGALWFESSSTTGQGLSRHFLNDKSLYHHSMHASFLAFFGQASRYTHRFLLPSYLERSHSSLVYMAQMFLEQSGKGGFYLNQFEQLQTDLRSDMNKGEPTILWGVSFALYDFALQHPMDLSGALIIETGGMKGRRREMIRSELHEVLQNGFQTDSIASEYGMTELLSQAYALHDGLFACPPQMRITISKLTSPLEPERQGKTGLVNIMDLCNLESCCFIATSDLGRLQNGTFEIMGRFDHSESRGCNLMYS